MERWNCCRSWRSTLPGLGLGGKSFGFGFQAAVIGGIALKQNDAAIKRQHIELNGNVSLPPGTVSVLDVYKVAALISIQFNNSDHINIMYNQAL